MATKQEIEPNRETRSGRSIHQEAEKTREKGFYLEALQLADEAALAYLLETDLRGFAETRASRSITFRHLYRTTGDIAYLKQARNEATAAVDLVLSQKDKSAHAIPFFHLANCQEALGELEEAEQSYRNAVEVMEKFPPPSHNRPAVLLDFKVHLYTVQYKLGQTMALEWAEQALDELRQTDEDPFNKAVWLSGGHMRIAEMLWTDNKHEAVSHLLEAERIIYSNPELTLRNEQLNALKDKLQA